MSKIKDSFKTQVVDTLDKTFGKWLTMDDLKMLGNEYDAMVPITGLDVEGLPTPILRLFEQQSNLFVEARELVCLGSPGSLMNCAPQEFMESLIFIDSEADGEFEKRRPILLNMLANTYLSSARTSDELLASVIQASNANTLFTNAIKNPRNGEIYITARMSCDFASIPDDFKNIVAAVIDHSARIRRFVNLMRRDVLPDTNNMEMVIASMLTMFSKGGSDPKDGVSSPPSPDKSPRATL
jgi:hypothetical protein